MGSNKYIKCENAKGLYSDKCFCGGCTGCGAPPFHYSEGCDLCRQCLIVHGCNP